MSQSSQSGKTKTVVKFKHGVAYNMGALLYPNIWYPMLRACIEIH
jgi:hypothetical protein